MPELADQLQSVLSQIGTLVNTIDADPGSGEYARGYCDAMSDVDVWINRALEETT